MASIQREIGTLGETKDRILELLLGGSKSGGEVAETLQIQKSARVRSGIVTIFRRR